MLDINDNNEILDFNITPSEDKNIIKVIGVGGGGGNAVNHMFHKGIVDVSFVVCNTDKQALEASPVPVKLQLGKEGLGAGNIPAKAREAAEETIDGIHNMLNDGTKMTFITAGMGGGTGTGAAPVIARESKNMDILTVGIVTIPFRFEGKNKITQALDGVEKLAENVDALLVINNERLRKIYGDLSLLEGFAKADDTLTVAAKSIAEIITVRGLMNLDFNDVKTVLKDGGVAIMSTGYGEGEGRLKKAIDDALNSPLLNDRDIYHSKKILLSISFHSDDKDCKGLMMEEMADLNDFMDQFGNDYVLKWGLAIDPTLGDKVKVTILATGFNVRDVDGMTEHINAHKTEEDIAHEAELREKNQKDIERMNTYYGNDGKSQVYKQTPQVYLFRPEDLDNEEIILAIENEPTVKRTAKKLAEIRALSKAGHASEDTKGDDRADAAQKQGVIRFGMDE